MHKTIRIAIVDDYQPAREKLIKIVKEINGIELVTVASNGVDFIHAIEALPKPPHIALVDYQMHPVDGISVLHYLNCHHASIKLICITGYDETTAATEAFNAGASGFITKVGLKIDASLLKDAIDTILKGNIYIEQHPSIQINIATATALKEQSLNSISQQQITKRERLFAILNASSLTYKDISTTLNVSLRTVESTSYRLNKKLDAKGNRLTLLKTALQHGLIKLGSLKKKLKHEF
jgi:DNA-binding NarL/FixJ family response regulator